MNDGEHATHRHKRLGEVVLLRSTSELAQILTLSGEKFWVKLTDLTEVTENAGKDSPSKGRQRTKRDRNR